MEYISNNSVTCSGNLLKVSICLKLFHDVVEAFCAEILCLYFDKFIEMIFKLALLKLFEVVAAQDHVLDQLCDFLVEFDDVGLSVDEVLNGLPVLEQKVVVGLLRATSKTVYQLTEHLCGSKRLHLWLLDPEDIRVEIEPDLMEALDHLLLD